MESWIVVKTAPEISLKSGFVRSMFMKRLEWNIKNSLSANNLKAWDLDRKGGRIFFKTENPEKCLKVLRKVFGIHALAIAEKHSPAELPAIGQEAASFAKKHLKKGQSFAVRAKIGAKKQFNSHAVEVQGGDSVLNAVNGLKVNLSKPDVKIVFEIFENSFYVYAGQRLCEGGLPVGVSGKTAFFPGKKLSCDFNACWLLMKRGCEIVLVGKSEKLAKKLNAWNSFNDLEVVKSEQEAVLKECVCFATSDSKIDEKSIAGFEKFDSERKFLVLRPLLLFPKELLKGAVD
ncbi:MAG: THUMP domain-containing protein [Candidatus Diapherotrites archaeon]|nr:THUMP domain-containing protein [Candidatus Diapherotrites archaeon]